MRPHTNAVPGPSTSPFPINLTDAGPVPGRLDPLQPARILRDATSELHFSAFDPLTAGGQDASLNIQQRLNIQDERTAPKRIVVEVVRRTGKSTWRFVPRARREEGVEDEGLWPRVIDLCGSLVHIGQDQWDIYKLDPAYDCLVRKSPALTTIRPSAPGIRHPPVEPTPLGKRPYHESEPLIPEGSNKRLHLDVTMESIRDTASEGEAGDNEKENEDEDEEEEDLVAEMVTEARARYRTHIPDSAPTPRPLRKPVPLSRRTQPTSPNTPKPRVTRGPAPLQRRQSQSVPPEPLGKRKEAFDSNLESPREEDDHYDGPKRKKVNFAPSPMTNRAPSQPPMPSQRELRAKRREREEQKRKRFEEAQRTRRREREEREWREILAGVATPQEHFQNSGIDRDSSMRGFSDIEDLETPISESQVSPEEASEAAKLEESKRKIAELEADRPIWEQAAREREAREAAEAAAARERAEARKRKEQERLQQEMERMRRHQEEAEARIRREEEKKEAERAQRAQERNARRARWTSGRWTNARAVERFKETSDFFDMARFSEEHPLSIDDVPWPTLRHPDAFSLPEDVDWDSVEHFFEVLKGHMRTQEYITLVEKSHRRFHPDRWRSRGLFKSVLDPEERNYMEVAATTVSQALTPIWQKVRVMKQA